MGNDRNKPDKASGWVARAHGNVRADEMMGDRTNDVSVTWGNTRDAAVANVAATGLAGPYRVVKVAEITRRNGRVMPAPLANNLNHCNLFGLSVKDLKNLFS